MNLLTDGLIITIWCFLLDLGREYGIGHQEDCELRCGISLEQRVREPKRIVYALRTVRRVIDDNESLHKYSFYEDLLIRH